MVDNDVLVNIYAWAGATPLFPEHHTEALSRITTRPRMMRDHSRLKGRLRLHEIGECDRRNKRLK